METQKDLKYELNQLFYLLKWSLPFKSQWYEQLKSCLSLWTQQTHLHPYSGLRLTIFQLRMLIQIYSSVVPSRDDRVMLKLLLSVSGTGDSPPAAWCTISPNMNELAIFELAKEMKKRNMFHHAFNMFQFFSPSCTHMQISKSRLERAIIFIAMPTKDLTATYISDD